MLLRESITVFNRLLTQASYSTDRMINNLILFTVNNGLLTRSIFLTPLEPLTQMTCSLCAMLDVIVVRKDLRLFHSY